MSKVEFINPESIARSPAFSQGAVITGDHKTIYVGGQNAIDKDGNIIGKDDIEKQAAQVLTNVEAVLKSAGAGLEHIVKWNIYFLKGQSPQNALKAIQPRLPKLKDPQLVTGIFVEALTRPEFLLEIEAIAVVPS
ncbi:MAG TPA: RidA family protein [Cyclobacteriaceae bacterium]|nr:RidA family protein [Cyclobacteriaceae bacterium]